MFEFFVLNLTECHILVHELFQTLHRLVVFRLQYDIQKYGLNKVLQKSPTKTPDEKY